LARTPLYTAIHYWCWSSDTIFWAYAPPQTTFFANLKTYEKVLDYAIFPRNVFHTLVCYVNTETNVMPSHSRSVSPCNDHYKKQHDAVHSFNGGGHMTPLLSISY